MHQTTLGLQLFEPVKMRASQINGCAYCLDTDSKALRTIRAHRFYYRQGLPARALRFSRPVAPA